MRIDTANRTRLETVIPLDTPYVVFIDPSSVCNRKCQFCPTGNPPEGSNVKRGVMSLGLFSRAIQQIKQFPRKLKVLRMYKDGEPLMNPWFVDMVRYAKESHVAKSIDTTTNGTLLNDKMSDAIISAGLDRINISVPRDYDNQYIRNIAYLYCVSRGKCKVFCKIAGDYINGAERTKFLKMFSPISDDIAVEHTAPCWPGYEVDGINSNVGIYGQPIQPDIKVCPYVFYIMNINYDGTVDLCFVDWARKVILGKVYEDNLVDIWNGEKMREVRFTMLAGLRHTLPHCGECLHHIYGQPDNIDAYADELIKKL